MVSAKALVTLRDRSVQLEGSEEFVERHLTNPEVTGRIMRVIADALGSEQREKAWLTEGLDHAWQWFSLHAGQRMQGVNFFLVAIAFLSAAFVTALRIPSKPIASGVALFGVLISLCFTRLELRIIELIHAGETALKPLQANLAQLAGVAELRILEHIETPKRRLTRYSEVIGLLHWGSAVVFMIGAFAAWFWNP